MTMCGGVLCHTGTSHCLSVSPDAAMMAPPRRGACLARVDHNPAASLASARDGARGAGPRLTCAEAWHRAAVARGIVRPGMPTMDRLGVALPSSNGTLCPSDLVQRARSLYGSRCFFRTA